MMKSTQNLNNKNRSADILEKGYMTRYNNLFLYSYDDHYNRLLNNSYQTLAKF